MHRGVLAAIHQFPAKRRAIEELALKSETFRLLCTDLADAEAALYNWKGSDSPLKDERCAEYLSLVTALKAEILEILDAEQSNAAE
ncbi:hypothetical protein GGR16_001424 [Chelatococcus caeni]|uniref:Uncharacterized protein n=1 Tax=Chelatococcus caeni TaxID=1348468 RepID=A0A840BYB1_9HYPH|nr:hypothetical protein [Chelatococcus caeni]MBB4016418.1 hypothetical protein [Chelatococcus caeni]